MKSTPLQGSTQITSLSGNRGNGGNNEESAGSSVHCDRSGSNSGASVVAHLPVGCSRVTGEWEVLDALADGLADLPTDQVPLTQEEEQLLERLARGVFK